MCVLPCTSVCLHRHLKGVQELLMEIFVQLTSGEAKSRCRIRRNSSGCHGTRWFYSRKHHYQNQKGVCVCTRVYTCVCVCVCARARVRVGVDAAKTLDVSVWCAHLRGAKYMNLREGLCAHQSVAHRSHSQLLPCACTSNTQELPIVSNSARNDSSPVHRYEPDSSTQAPVSWR